MPRVLGKNVVSTKWVLTNKLNADGTLQKRKARLVARGFTQLKGVDYDEVFAPVVKMTTIRVILTIAAVEDLEIHQMDVKTAFLNGKLEEEVYIEQPEGYVEPGKEDLVCRLHKTLYGLKQSPRVWWQTVDAFFESVGFQRVESDYGVYIKWNDQVHFIISVYVDDIILICNHLKELEQMKVKLRQQWEMTDLGELNFILGIRVQRDRTRHLIWLDQERYANDVLKRFNMSHSKPMNTPCEAGRALRRDMSPSTATERSMMQGIPYASAVRSLMYTMTATRPDLGYAISSLSAYIGNPGQEHWKAVKRVLRYLRHTSSYQLELGGNKLILQGYCDSDWASSPDDRRSITGYAFTLGTGAISWKSQRQKTVALSSTEAEYMAASSATRELLWLRNLLSELHQTQQTVTLHCDNQGCIALANNPTYHQRTKHIDTQYHFIREQVEKQIVRLTYIPTHQMMADVLTKPLPRLKHQLCVLQMRLDDRPSSQSGSVE